MILFGNKDNSVFTYCVKWKKDNAYKLLDGNYKTDPTLLEYICVHVLTKTSMNYGVFHPALVQIISTKTANLLISQLTKKYSTCKLNIFWIYFNILDYLEAKTRTLKT